MKYSELRDKIKTGDVLAVKGAGFFSSLIRVFTGESYSHVAMFVWDVGGLFVFEFVEGVGYQSMPASEWLRRRSKQRVLCCIAPETIHENAFEVSIAAKSYRNAKAAQRSYGWLSLLKVWVSQITSKRFKVRQLVCSTFVQHCWQAGQVTLNNTADPGTIVAACHTYYSVEDI